MVEVLVAGALVGAGVAFAARRQEASPLPRPHVSLPGVTEQLSDLPCPWCNSATREDDERCPSCGQRFG